MEEAEFAWRKLSEVITKLRTGQETPRLYGAVNRQGLALKPPDSKGATDLTPRVQCGFVRPLFHARFGGTKTELKQLTTTTTTTKEKLSMGAEAPVEPTLEHVDSVEKFAAVLQEA